MKFRVLVTEKIDSRAIDYLKLHADVEIGTRGELDTEDALITKLEGFNGVISMLSNPFTERVLNSAKNLKIVANYAVGYNNIDVNAANKLGIKVTNTPNVLSEATADIALALLLSVCRKILPAERDLRNGNFDGWHPDGFVGIELNGKKAGIIGMGRIGKAIAKRLNGFGIKVLYHNRKKIDGLIEKELSVTYQANLEAMLSSIDFLFLSCPLTPETRHILNKSRLSILPKHAVVINTGRGPLIDEQALADALVKGELAGAGLDVFEFEPSIVPDLLKAPNTVLLPHIGSATAETRHNMGMLAAESVIGILHGKADHEIKNLIR